MKVLLLHDDLPVDARADELDVLVQADAIAKSLANLGHTSERLAFTLDLGRVTDAIRARAPDVVFNLVESVEGRGRLIYLAPALLDSLHLPYTGAGAEAMLLTSGKLLTKKLLHAHGIATPPWFTATGESEPHAGDAGARAAGVSGRYIIKSVWEEASIGLDDGAIIEPNDAESLRNEIHARAARLGGAAFAEQYIEGREFNLALLAGPPEGVSGRSATAIPPPQVLPPAEIRFVDYPPGKPHFVGYRAKWDDQSFEYHHTPRTFDFPPEDGPLLELLSEIARRCWDLLGLRGYVRVDFRVDAAGRPWVLEINANPCLSPDAGYPAAAARAGMSLDDVIARVLADAQRAAVR